MEKNDHKKFWEGRRVLVTGGTGFVGSWVVQALVEKGAQVTCLVRPTSNLRWIESLPVRRVQGSLFDVDSLKDALDGMQHVLHIAGVTKALRKSDYYSGNVTATRNLFAAIQKFCPEVQSTVHLSSQAAVGPSPTPEAIDETHPPHPITDYGKSKLASEFVVREFMNTFPVAILRPPAVYGPRDTDILEVFRSVKKGLNINVGRKERLVSIIHVQDLAEGILLAARNPAAAGQTYFICNDEPVEWNMVMNVLQRMMNRRVITIVLPFIVVYMVAFFIELYSWLKRKPSILNRQKMKEIRAPYWVISNQKIKRELGFHQDIPLEEGLKQTHDWYVNQGWL